jgi:hypothetical protein
MSFAYLIIMTQYPGNQYSLQINKMTKQVIAAAALFLSSIFSFGQDSPTPAKNSSDQPVWVKMMDDPNVNYYSALKAYDEYWKDHKKPAGEEEEMMEGNKDRKEIEREKEKERKKNNDNKLSPEELKAMNDNEDLNYQVKRFEQWRREVKPYVQEDGRILTQEERMEIWKKQQEEIKSQKKN